VIIAKEGAISIKLRKDHIELVKFKATTDIDYRIVLSQLRTMVSAVRDGGMTSPTEEDVTEFLERMKDANPDTEDAEDEDEDQAAEKVEDEVLKHAAEHPNEVDEVEVAAISAEKERRKQSYYERAVELQQGMQKMALDTAAEAYKNPVGTAKNLTGQMLAAPGQILSAPKLPKLPSFGRKK
jgi:hypothetical protein